MNAPVRSAAFCTIDDIYNLPDGRRAELTGGELYMMAAPGVKHQRLVSELHFLIKSEQGYMKIW